MPLGEGGGEVGVGVGADQAQVELVLEEFEDVGGEEAWGFGSEADSLDAEGEEGEEDGDGLLFEPGDDEGQGELVDGAAEGVGEGEGDLDRAVGVVALAHVEEAG